MCCPVEFATPDSALPPTEDLEPLLDLAESPCPPALVCRRRGGGPRCSGGGTPRAVHGAELSRVEGRLLDREDGLSKKRKLASACASASAAAAVAAGDGGFGAGENDDDDEEQRGEASWGACTASVWSPSPS